MFRVGAPRPGAARGRARGYFYRQHLVERRKVDDRGRRGARWPAHRDHRLHALRVDSWAGRPARGPGVWPVLRGIQGADARPGDGLRWIVLHLSRGYLLDRTATDEVRTAAGTNRAA